MSSATPRQEQPATSEPNVGLDLNDFLNALDWASDSHSEIVAEGSNNTTCLACKPHSLESGSEDIPVEIDRISGHATFRVAEAHFMSFSPALACNRPLRRIPAALSVQDGSLRLALATGPAKRKRCVTLDTTKMADSPILSHTDDDVRLEFSLPFVTLLIEKSRQSPKGSKPVHPNTDKLHYGAMREAVLELQHATPSSAPRGIASGDEEKRLPCKSNFEANMKGVLEEEPAKRMTLDSAFTNFLIQGSTMIMPPCFPYESSAVPISVAGNTNTEHAAFVKAYAQLEASYTRVSELVDTCVRLADRKKSIEEGKNFREGSENERVEALDGKAAKLD